MGWAWFLCEDSDYFLDSVQCTYLFFGQCMYKTIMEVNPRQTTRFNCMKEDNSKNIFKKILSQNSHKNLV